MILRNLKSLIRRYPVAVVLNFTGLVAALLAEKVSLHPAITVTSMEIYRYAENICVKILL